VKWFADKSFVANSADPAGRRVPQHNDLVSPTTRRLAKPTIVFLLAMIVLAVIVAVAARTAIYVLQPSQVQSSASQ
jgi:hypothetical protein